MSWLGNQQCQWFMTALPRHIIKAQLLPWQVFFFFMSCRSRNVFECQCLYCSSINLTVFDLRRRWTLLSDWRLPFCKWFCSYSRCESPFRWSHKQACRICWPSLVCFYVFIVTLHMHEASWLPSEVESILCWSRSCLLRDRIIRLKQAKGILKKLRNSNALVGQGG